VSFFANAGFQFEYYHGWFRGALAYNSFDFHSASELSPKRRPLTAASRIMKKIVFGILLTAGLTIASGLLQGSLCNRWGASEEQRRVGAKLEECPTEVPHWNCQKEKMPLEQVAIDQLIPYGYFQRQYVSQDGGDAITVTVMVGPSGTLSVHTPEVCFSGLNFDKSEERKKIEIPGLSDGDTIWRVAMRSKKVDGNVVESYYAWSKGDRWVAEESPRYKLAIRPYIYKIQLHHLATAEVSGKANSAADPSMRFLMDLLPVLEKYLEKPANK
jgi:hypothetical protein